MGWLKRGRGGGGGGMTISNDTANKFQIIFTTSFLLGSISKIIISKTMANINGAD